MANLAEEPELSYVYVESLCKILSIDGKKHLTSGFFYRILLLKYKTLFTTLL
ncbi:MAG: hypothetical protein ABIN36_08825 [Ferruginibacter sp.]